MSSNTTDTHQGKQGSEALSSGRSRQRRLILALTVLAFLAIGSVAAYAISLILGAVILLMLSALLAYLIYPLVQFLQRRLPRSLAIGVAYLLVAGVMAVSLFIVTSSLVQQSSSLAQSIQILLSPAGERRIQGVIDLLGKIGITKDQVTQIKNQLFTQVMGALSGLIPFLSGLLGNFIDLIAGITLSVYFVLDGPRIIRWLSLKTPVTLRSPVNFLLHALDQSLGGYFRGSLLLALIGALGTGVGLALLRVPYSALLGLLFFLFYFIPVVGPYAIEALCILAALPLGWTVMLIVGVYMTLLQGVVMGQILSPRIFSKTVGVYPIVALFALFAGGELFGLLGGFLSVPVAGVLQQIIVALWRRWKHEHPEQLPPEELPPQKPETLPEQEASPLTS
ncbi:MAG TPA: AI-2E family transporter [Ktedonobacteraceae bacterium]